MRSRRLYNIVCNEHDVRCAVTIAWELWTCLGGGGRTERHTGKRVRWSQRAERWAAKKTKNENGKGRLFYICTKELNDFILVVRV